METIRRDSDRMRSLISPKYLKVKNIKRFRESSIKRVVIESIEYCTYFLTDGEYIKIGVAASLPNRIRQLQTANARRIKALYIIPSENQREAMRIEKALHKYFRGKNLMGEWFNISINEIKTGCNAIQEELYIPASKFDFEIDGIELI